MPPPRSEAFEVKQAAVVAQNANELTCEDTKHLFNILQTPEPDSPTTASLRAELKGVSMARYRYNIFRLVLLHSRL